MGLKLTVARYYTPSGRSIQEKGVQPDIILDDFDSKLLAEARRKQDFLRERDLKGHMINTDGEEGAKEFKKEELEKISKKDDKSKDSKDKDKDEDEMSPLKFNPKEDYQVREALNYLKSYDVFKKFAAFDQNTAQTAGTKVASPKESPKSEPRETD